uniref:Retrovirus-related Pol polyprotein from transposon TNT 1-94 n=1 Tax=Vitis vinifera TaxID=29760 RepID=A5C9T3_VITVI|nr:hypothetical protein VITISV_001087 [Vitis vinifera]
MKDLGAAKQILGMIIIRDKANGTLKLSQSEYVKKVLRRFNMNKAKSVSTPLGSHFKLSKEQSPKTKEERDHMSKMPYASAIGSLMYAMVCTRSDIAHAVGVVSKFMSRPGKQHWEAIKWILRYLKGSLDTCLCFIGASLKLQGYVDADFAGDIDSRKSTTEFVFTLGSTTISWASNLQKIVTLSTTEAEYVAATEAGKEMIWLHGFLDELGKKQEMDILHSDSSELGIRFNSLQLVSELGLKISRRVKDHKAHKMKTKGIFTEGGVDCSFVVKCEEEREVPGGARWLVVRYGYKEWGNMGCFGKPCYFTLPYVHVFGVGQHTFRI